MSTLRIYSEVSGTLLGAVNRHLSIPYKGLYAHRSLSTRFGTEFSFQVFYDLALCYRSPLLSVMKLRLLTQFLRNSSKVCVCLVIVTSILRSGLLWQIMLKRYTLPFNSPWTRLSCLVGVITWLYYRRVSQVPSDCASFVAILVTLLRGIRRLLVTQETWISLSCLQLRMTILLFPLWTIPF